MRILHLNTFNYGGAFNSADSLCRSLKNRGIDVEHLTESNIKPFLNSKLFDKFLKSIYWRILRRFYLRNYLFKTSIAFPFFILKKHYLKQILAYKPDIVHFHWIDDFIDYKYTFRELNKRKISMIFTVHDRGIMLGGYHYRVESDNETSKYYHGFALGSSNRIDFDNRVFNLKKKSFESLNSENIYFVSPSVKLKEEILKSYLSRFDITHIPNSVDNTIFKVVENRTAREKLKIPVEKKVLLFCAYNLDNHWKGIDILLTALNRIIDDYHIIALGKSTRLKSDKNITIVNSIDSKAIINKYYSDADVFVTPTLEDNLPNTILESLACGTPVIGSNVGGVPDMVREGITGMLFECGNSEQLAQKIEDFFALSEEKRKEMSRNCRRIAVEEYSQEVQAKAYIELYEKILEKQC